MEYFIKGGLYAALPIITALYFSIVYGSFASTVISILGLQAAQAAPVTDSDRRSGRYRSVNLDKGDGKKDEKMDSW